MAQNDFPQLRTLFEKNREILKMLRNERQLTDKQIVFTAVYSKLGKKIAETKDKTIMSAFSNVICGRYQVCVPDGITISWHDSERGEKLFEHTFSITKQQTPEEPSLPRMMAAPVTFQGLGEADVNNLVEKRLSDLRRTEEQHRLQDENAKLQAQVSTLTAENADLKHDIAAKETTENYMRILGMALPGLSKFFGGAGILHLLAGTEEKEEQATSSIGATATETTPNPVAKDEREQMISMLRDYMLEELSQQEVATLYLMFVEIQKDKTVIQQLLNQITQQS